MPSSFLKQLGCWVGVHGWRGWVDTNDEIIKIPIKGSPYYTVNYDHENFQKQSNTCTRCGRVKYRLERIF